MRGRNAARHRADQTPERLAVREEVQHLRAKRLIRKFDDDPESI
jgi:hypothetical protein